MWRSVGKSQPGRRVVCGCRTCQLGEAQASAPDTPGGHAFAGLKQQPQEFSPSPSSSHHEVRFGRVLVLSGLKGKIWVLCRAALGH